MIEKRCLTKLAYIQDTSADTSTVDSVPVERFVDSVPVVSCADTSNVFPIDLLGISVERNINCGIDLVPRTHATSIPPFCINIIQM